MPPTPIKKKNYTADSQKIPLPDEVEDTLNAWKKKNKQKPIPLPDEVEDTLNAWKKKNKQKPKKKEEEKEELEEKK